MITYTRGQIVTLPAIPREHIPEEQAIVLELPENGVMLVYCFEQIGVAITDRLVEAPVNRDGSLMAEILGPTTGVH